MKKRNIRKFFKAADFDECISDKELDDLPFHNPQVKRSQTDLFAGYANSLLCEWLNKQPKVYGDNNGHWGPDLDDEGRDTHEARLIDVKPIGQNVV